MKIKLFYFSSTSSLSSVSSGFISSYRFHLFPEVSSLCFLNFLVRIFICSVAIFFWCAFALLLFSLLSPSCFLVKSLFRWFIIRAGNFFFLSLGPSVWEWPRLPSRWSEFSYDPGLILATIAWIVSSQWWCFSQCKASAPLLPQRQITSYKQLACMMPHLVLVQQNSSHQHMHLLPALANKGFHSAPLGVPFAFWWVFCRLSLRLCSKLSSLHFLCFFFFFFPLCHASCKTLVPWPGIEPGKSMET